MDVQYTLVSFDEFIAAARRYGHPTMAIQFDGDCQAFMQLGIDENDVAHELVVKLDQTEVFELVSEYLTNGQPVLPCGPNV